jgi:hypothetical protein
LASSQVCGTCSSGHLVSIQVCGTCSSGHLVSIQVCGTCSSEHLVSTSVHLFSFSVRAREFEKLKLIKMENGKIKKDKIVNNEMQNNKKCPSCLTGGGASVRREIPAFTFC